MFLKVKGIFEVVPRALPALPIFNPIRGWIKSKLVFYKGVDPTGLLIERIYVSTKMSTQRVF
jgi:hypothetical protein